MYDQIARNKKKTMLLLFSFLLINIAIWYGIVISFNMTIFLLVFVIIFSIGLWMISYLYGDKVIIQALEAHRLHKNFHPQLEQIVEEMSIAAGIPKPNLFQINSMNLNACAMGRNPENASLVVTMGTVFELTDEELRGVIAHEISHIRNYDILYHTVLSALIGIANLINRLLKVFTGWDASGGLGVILSLLGFFASFYLIFIAGFIPTSISLKIFGQILIIIFFSLLLYGGRIVRSIFSQNREFLADVCAVELTRNPEGLIKALQKMNRETNIITTASSATTHLFIVDPQLGFFRALVLKTHPPIKERIRRLRNLTIVPVPLEELPKKKKEGAACPYKFRYPQS